MKAQRQRVNMREGRDADLAQGVILHLGENAVAQLRQRLHQDARDDLARDQAAMTSRSTIMCGIVVETVDQPSRSDRAANSVRRLGEDQTDDANDHPQPQVRPALRPEIGHQHPERTQGRRAVAFFDHRSRHLVPHIAAAEGEKTRDQGEQRDGGDDDERTRHG